MVKYSHGWADGVNVATDTRERRSRDEQDPTGPPVAVGPSVVWMVDALAWIAAMSIGWSVAPVNDSSAPGAVELSLAVLTLTTAGIFTGLHGSRWRMARSMKAQRLSVWA
jgi:hypothetical protein